MSKSSKDKTKVSLRSHSSRVKGRTHPKNRLVPTMLLGGRAHSEDKGPNSREVQTTVPGGTLSRNPEQTSLEKSWATFKESKTEMSVMFKGMEIGEAVYNPDKLEIKASGFGFANITKLTEVFNKMKNEIGLPPVTRKDVNSSVDMLSPGPQGFVMVKWAAFTDIGRQYLEMIANALEQSYPNLFVSHEKAGLDKSLSDKPAILQKNATEVIDSYEKQQIEARKAILDDPTKRSLLTGDIDFDKLEGEI